MSQSTEVIMNPRSSGNRVAPAAPPSPRPAVAEPRTGGAAGAAIHSDAADDKPSGRSGGDTASRASVSSVGSHKAVTRRVDKDHPPLDNRELRAWYSADFANSVFYQVVIGAYLPLLLQQVALESAGFPEDCPNYAAVRGNQTLSTLVFGDPRDEFFIDNAQYGKSDCTSDCVFYSGNTYCDGEPSSPLECLTADGHSRHRLTVEIGDWVIDPTEYALLFIGLSVLFQFVAFLLCGSLGDYGTMRKQVYALTTWIGSATCCCCIAVTTELWWLGGVLTVLANLAFGISVLMYNAWLPLLVESHWTFLALPATASVEERRQVGDTIAGHISARGFAWGYVGGLLCLLITLPIVVTVDSEVAAYRTAVFVGGVWWFLFSWPSIILLRRRPGPPLPEGTKSYALHSLREFYITFGRLRQLRSTFKWMLCYFVYSDSVAVMGGTAILFANTEVDWGCIPKTVGIAALLLGTPILAVIGLVTTEKLAERHEWEPKWLIIGSLGVLTLIPIYGLIGFGTTEFGLHKGWEMFVLLVIYALPLGVLQSYSRSYFSNVIPPGYESQFFSLFAITDKGSSIFSPIIVSQIVANSEFRYVFIYVLVLLVVPAIAMMPLDPRLAHEQALEYADAHPRSDEVADAEAESAAGGSGGANGSAEEAPSVASGPRLSVPVALVSEV